MKKHYFAAVAAVLAFGGFLASCTHDDLDYTSIVEDKKAEYQKVFVQTYGPIDPNQTWGFNAATPRGTRAASQWTLSHDDSWMSYLDFEKPTSGYTEVTSSTQLTGSGTYYVPASYSGAIQFDNFNGKLYIAGTVTSFSGNVGTAGLYILQGGTWKPTSTFSTGTVTAYNQGTLILPAGALNSQNLKTIYNGGQLTIGDGNSAEDFSNGVSIYSNGAGIIEIYGKTGSAVDLKLACDVHGKMKVYGDLKIQNGETQYICGLEVSGYLDMTQGKLETSYVKADEIKFDGAEIWLLEEGHVEANTIKMSNSATYIHGHTGSLGLVEVKDWYFRNHNNFESAFSSNIYFQVDGSIDIEEILTRENGQNDNVSTLYATLSDYLASQNGKKLDEGRFNAAVSGTPECGATYGKGVTIPTDKSEEGEQIEVETTTQYYENTELVEQGRVFCEDLGQISTNDLDFNDVVFDAYVYRVTPSTRTTVKENGVITKTNTEEGTPTYKTTIVLLAAGGTLPLTVANIEVHNMLGGAPTSTIINTITSSGEAYGNAYATSDPVILGADFNFASIMDIPIRVLYASSNDEVLELTAKVGEAPHKILVPVGTKWCKERVNIAEAYPDFNSYVGSSKKFWEGKIDESKLYPSEGAYPPLPTQTGKKLVKEETSTSYRNGEGTTGGYQQGEPVLSRERR